MHRRDLLRWSVGVLGAGGMTVDSRAALATETPTELLRVDRDPRGTTLTFGMNYGPFPCRGSSYNDNTTIVFVPSYFRLRQDRIDVVVHFHGHRTTAARAMEDHQLREQLYDSLQDAVLVMPQGPVRAADSSGGKLDRENGLLDFLTEIRRALQRRDVRDELGGVTITQTARVGHCILSGHSGGYRVIARCLEHGGYNVNEVVLLDALYGEVDRFRDWIAERRGVEHPAERHKLVSWYATREVRRNNERLMQDLERAGIPFVHETRSQPITRRQFTNYRAVFVETVASHQGAAFRHNNLRDSLFSSCLTRHLATDWFDAAGTPRTIDERDR